MASAANHGAASSGPSDTAWTSNGIVALEQELELDLNDKAATESTSSKPKYPPIPRTPADRLSLPDASPTPFPSEPAPASAAPYDAGSVLYLAYGSNMAAQTFQGVRGIRPLSAVAVSAPSLRLIFDLPGLPYREPCFANVGLRKIPKPPVPIPDPPKFPPEIPDLPDPPPIKPPQWELSLGANGVASDGVERNAAGDPVWTQGMIGVVYEVTRDDFAKIIKTEGGGASYHDIVVPCIPLPPSMHVPEKPPVPELPRPFLAHTLLAPSVPNDPRDLLAGDGDDGDEPEKPAPKPPSWLARLFMPRRRPDPDYSQASKRYLNLLIQGGKEHDLPPAYQAYLSALLPYTMTTRSQKIGGMAFLMFWFPPAVLVFTAQRLVANRKTGKSPAWMLPLTNFLFNVAWLSYDYVAKPLFGDGERTQEEGAEGHGEIRLESKKNRRMSLTNKKKLDDEEDVALI